MVQKIRKPIASLFLCLSLSAYAHPESFINMNALCYESKSECIRARSLIGARSQLPLYAYVKPCAQDTLSPARGRSFCAKGDWRMETQIRSSLGLQTINQHLSKYGSASLRTTCVSTCRNAQELIEFIEDGANGDWTSIRQDYKIQLTCKKVSDVELLKLKNKECEDKDYWVEYQLVKNI